MFKSIRLIAVLIACSFSVEATIYDNRYFPFYSYIFPRINRKPSWANTSIYFVTADDARDEVSKVGIPELCGFFDQKQLGRALQKVGLDNPLRPDFQLLPGIPWNLAGKLTGQGVGFEGEQALSEHFSVGLSAWFLHTSSSINFILDPVLARDLGFNNGKEGDLFELDRELRSMLQELGLEGGQWSKSGVTDVDLYLRYGNIWESVWKFRSVGAGIRVGVLAPSGSPRTIDSAASVPFSGNKHPGFYVEGDFELELKEDIYCGGLLRVIGRKSECEEVRFSALGEPPLFGTISANANVDPGVGVAFSLYGTFEGIREGLGLQGRYTISYHHNDCFSGIEPCEDLTIQEVDSLSVDQLVACSTFISEYFSLNLFYDFATPDNCRRFDATLFFAWDIPIDVLAAKNFVRTNRIALGFQMNY
ncbi:MAG: hypothetical protein WD068_00865 [Candidatus Babeliales bacterium]